jgi:hypothetical protein
MPDGAFEHVNVTVLLPLIDAERVATIFGGVLSMVDRVDPPVRGVAGAVLDKSPDRLPAAFRADRLRRRAVVDAGHVVGAAELDADVAVVPAVAVRRRARRREAGGGRVAPDRHRARRLAARRRRDARDAVHLSVRITLSPQSELVTLMGDSGS